MSIGIRNNISSSGNISIDIIIIIIIIICISIGIITITIGFCVIGTIESSTSCFYPIP